MEHDNISIINEPAVKYGLSIEGIPKVQMKDIIEMTGMNFNEFSKLLPVSKRTIEKISDEEYLSPAVSDRLIQISSLYQHGVEVFENLDSFNTWLRTSLISLGDKKPIDFINSSTGISLVNDVIGRVAHGVYS